MNLFRISCFGFRIYFIMSFSLKKILSWKLVIVFNLALLLFFGFNFFKEWNRNRELDAEIKKLETAAKEVEAKNLDILNLAKYLDTEQFLEEQARTKLGLKKSGEQAVVVNLPQMETATSSETQSNAELSNSQKWWLRFFGR